MRIPSHIEIPKYCDSHYEMARKSKNIVKSSDEIRRMRIACSVARKVLDRAVSEVAVGVSTDHINKVVHEECIRLGAYPSPLLYHGFPKSVCTSINEVVCHGIPSSRRLMNGDIINIDVTCYKEGMHGDCSETVLVGEVSQEVKDLVEATREALYEGIKVVKPGVRISEIGRVVSNLAKSGGYGNVENFTGHGIGEFFHMPPSIPHFYDPMSIMNILEGMTFTIEPMFCLGSHKNRTLSDGWTEVTVDGLSSAQFEHTILVTKNGSEILTQ